MSLLPGARRPLVPPGAQPHPGYQAGLGRGATSFTTRADLGAAPIIGLGRGIPPAGRGRGVRDPFGAPPPGYVAGRGRGATGFAGGVSRDDATDDRGDYSETNYDEFSGYSEGLFKDGEYDEEDRQADSIYDDIDQKMDMRRKSRREERFKAEISKLRAEKPTLNQQFCDLKRGLKEVSQEEWESIPDIGDYSLKNKQKKQRFAPAPDSLLLSAHNMTQKKGSLDSRGGGGGGTITTLGFGLQTPLGLRTPYGLSTPLLGGGMTTNLNGFRTPLTGGNTTPSLNDLGEARGTVLSVKLDKVMDNVSGQTVIDPKGYLTDLNSMPVSTDAHIADVKKARLLLRSVTQTNPNHAPGWIAAARLEELAGKIQIARELIAQGCLHCPKNEDVWLEFARLERPSEAKSILANALKKNKASVKLWQEAAKKEEDVNKKKMVLRKALEAIPNSVRLWKDAISLEDSATARILLTRAVECIPQSIEMWLALARLSPYQDAQKILNEARKQVPTSIEIWISASKLEETYNNVAMVEKIMSRAIENLSAKGVVHDREVWIKHADDAEKTNYPHTCRAIIKATMNIGVEDVNRRRIWVTDAEAALGRGMIITARCLYTQILNVMPGSENVWISLMQLELHHGTPESLDQILKKAVEACPQSESLWLMSAKQKWLRGDISTARILLAEAFTHVANKEAVSLAAVKLERETGEFERARMLLDQSRVRCSKSEKVWMQSIQLERMLGHYKRAEELVIESLRLFPQSPKLWMIRGHLLNEQTPPDTEGALKIFELGRKECPKSVELWLCAVNVYREAKQWNRARALLEEARLRNPKQQLLWLNAVEIELEATGVSRSNWEKGQVESTNLQIPHHIMSKALQECPNSGILWAEAIFLEPKSAQNAKSVDALTACENDANVTLAVAKLFWRSNKIIKARRWVNRAVTLNPKVGDAWAGFFQLELLHGTDQSRKEIITRCDHAEPNKGLQWNKITKRPQNWRLSSPQKLRVVVEEIYPYAFDSKEIKNPIGTEILDLLHGRTQLSPKMTKKPENELITLSNELSTETKIK